VFNTSEIPLIIFIIYVNNKRQRGVLFMFMITNLDSILVGKKLRID